MAAFGGLQESGYPGLSVLLLFILLLFLWRLRRHFVLPLLPRPRRVRWVLT